MIERYLHGALPLYLYKVQVITSQQLAVCVHEWPLSWSGNKSKIFPTLITFARYFSKLSKVHSSHTLTCVWPLFWNMCFILYHMSHLWDFSPWCTFFTCVLSYPVSAKSLSHSDTGHIYMSFLLYGFYCANEYGILTYNDMIYIEYLIIIAVRDSGSVHNLLMGGPEIFDHAPGGPEFLAAQEIFLLPRRGTNIFLHYIWQKYLLK